MEVYVNLVGKKVISSKKLHIVYKKWTKNAWQKIKWTAWKNICILNIYIFLKKKHLQNQWRIKVYPY